MKRCIYIVDDQVAVLETAVLILRGNDDLWDVAGFSDPLEALAAVRAKAPDLILSDQLMPGMQGSQLLEEVRKIAPGAIRVIMSGYVSLSKLTLITSAHQYIAKPFEIARLREEFLGAGSNRQQGLAIDGDVVALDSLAAAGPPIVADGNK